MSQLFGMRGLNPVQQERLQAMTTANRTNEGVQAQMANQLLAQRGFLQPYLTQGKMDPNAFLPAYLAYATGRQDPAQQSLGMDSTTLIKLLLGL